ncbi:MAG: hypothetical protein ABSE62_16225 [Chthoniobacteraceae bacterium]|jgi:hypothetical protein
MSTTTTINFLPWRGENYDIGRSGKRILILGESHYNWDSNYRIEDDPEVTKRIIKEQIDETFTAKFWTNIAIMFLGKKPTPEEKRDFWHSVAFYNYVQYSAGEKPRIAPGADKFENSEPAFYEVLDTLKPQLLVVLGYRLWEHVPGTGWESGPAIESKENVGTGCYKYSEGSCFVVGVKHPSSGFNGLKWNPVITEAIKTA